MSILKVEENKLINSNYINIKFFRDNTFAIKYFEIQNLGDSHK